MACCDLRCFSGNIRQARARVQHVPLLTVCACGCTPTAMHCEVFIFSVVSRHCNRECQDDYLTSNLCAWNFVIQACAISPPARWAMPSATNTNLNLDLHYFLFSISSQTFFAQFICSSDVLVNCLSDSCGQSQSKDFCNLFLTFGVNLVSNNFSFFGIEKWAIAKNKPNINTWKIIKEIIENPWKTIIHAPIP